MLQPRSLTYSAFAVGSIAAIAGNGTGSWNGDGFATSSYLHHPSAVAMDPSGNVYVADGSNHRVRKVSPEGQARLGPGMNRRDRSSDDQPGGGQCSRVESIDGHRYGPGGSRQSDCCMPLRGRPAAAERRFGKESGLGVAGDLVSVDLGGERDFHGHRLGRVDLPRRLVAVDRAVLDLGGLAHGRLRAGQRLTVRPQFQL